MRLIQLICMAISKGICFLKCHPTHSKVPFSWRKKDQVPIQWRKHEMLFNPVELMLCSALLVGLYGKTGRCLSQQYYDNKPIACSTTQVFQRSSIFFHKSSMVTCECNASHINGVSATIRHPAMHEAAQ